jgi:hypothetical protein
MTAARRIPGPAAVAALAALALLGCSPSGPEKQERQAPAARIRLSTGNRDANVGPIVDLVRRTCLGTINAPEDFVQAVAASGWQSEQPEEAGGGSPLAIWRLDHGEIVYSMLPMEAAGSSFRDCALELDSAVAPRIELVRDALLPLIRHPSLRQSAGRPGEMVWRWQPESSEERVLTISPVLANRRAGNGTSARGLSIHVASNQFAQRPVEADQNEIGQ